MYPGPSRRPTDIVDPDLSPVRERRFDLPAPERHDEAGEAEQELARRLRAEWRCCSRPGTERYRQEIRNTKRLDSTGRYEHRRSFDEPVRETCRAVYQGVLASRGWSWSRPIRRAPKVLRSRSREP